MAADEAPAQQLRDRQCDHHVGLTTVLGDSPRLAAADASSWTETLVASYVWGQGDNGYGAYRLGEILRDSSAEAVLGRAVAVLADDGAVAAYRELRGAIRGLGPAFFTKFLYFIGGAVPDVPGPRPLVLDQRIARVVRAYATQVGQEAGLEQPARLATWLWSDGGWTPHRYSVYLRWMHGATEQLTRSAHWPPTPDLLELALFRGAWTPQRAPAGSPGPPGGFTAASEELAA
ncbi:hypothetical protein [Streptomyces sp. SP2-10]|uniref:8-oxoguanine DNA glycosylase OGG fold protein n=1 Tax=Streptomyces sp. SP2-10 TaxID=2873385 RepID=UPI001CA741D6|nr:hypothetical protein [Streptomyces sp. SP2-10]MBY8840392.1 hypothetical protein [Streptomyces sp. SP2-10]